MTTQPPGSARPWRPSVGEVALEADIETRRQVQAALKYFADQMNGTLQILHDRIVVLEREMAVQRQSQIVEHQKLDLLLREREA